MVEQEPGMGLGELEMDLVCEWVMEQSFIYICSLVVYNLCVDGL